MLKRTLWLILAATAVVGFVSLAPSTLGGPTVWVSTTGTSMEPGIHTGDLVIARPQAEYGVGDVVAYPSETLEGNVVLHRISARTDDGYLTKGDNNDWLDPDQPRAADILGASWLHIPGGGRVLSVLADPFVIAALVAVLLTAGGLVVNRRGRGRAGRNTFPAREYAAALAVAAVGLALFAFSRPATATSTEQVDVEHSAELSYSAPVTTPDVYSEDRIRTGDPVLLSVVSAVDTRLDYELGFEPGPVSGAIRSTIRLSAGNGWSREITAGPPVKIDGTRVEQTLPLDFSRLLRVVRTAERQARTTFGSYAVQVVHDIEARGTLAGQEVTTTSRPMLAFTLTDQQAVLQRASTAGAAGTPVTTSETSSSPVTRTEPATVSLLRWDVPVNGLRGLSLVLGLLALGLAAVAFSRRSTVHDPRAIFGARLVRASNTDFGERSIVDVEDTAALARLASTHDTVVLHSERAGSHLFLVVVDHTVYRCTEQRAHSPAETHESETRETAPSEASEHA